MLNIIQNECLLRKLHPLTAIFIISAYLLALMSINNVIYLLLIIISILYLAKVNNVFLQLYYFLKYTIAFVILIVFFNFILNHNGKTILFYFFNTPFTLESLFYGVFMSLRMTGIIIILALSNIIIDADEAFNYFSKFIGKSALLMSMMFRLTPRLIQLFNQIKEIEKLRGNSFNGNFIEKFKSYSQVINILFITSLEESVDIAEAMYSKGYGIKKRTSFSIKSFYKYDYLLISISVLQAVFLIIFILSGCNNYEFYPEFVNPFYKVNLFGLMLAIMFYNYSIINWWWINGSNKNK